MSLRRSVRISTDWRNGRKMVSRPYTKAEFQLDACCLLYALYAAADTFETKVNRKVARGVLFGLSINVLIQSGFRNGWIQPSTIYCCLNVTVPEGKQPREHLMQTGYCFNWENELEYRTRVWSVVHTPHAAYDRNGGQNTFKIDFHANAAAEAAGEEPLASIIVGSVVHGLEARSVDGVIQHQLRYNLMMDNLLRAEPRLAKGSAVNPLLRGHLKVDLESLHTLHSKCVDKVRNKLETPVKVAGSKNGDVFRGHLETPAYVNGLDLDVNSPHGKHEMVKWTRCGRDESLSDAFERLGMSPA